MFKSNPSPGVYAKSGASIVISFAFCVNVILVPCLILLNCKSPVVLSLAKNTCTSPAPLLDAKFDSPVFSTNSNAVSPVLTLNHLCCSPV